MFIHIIFSEKQQQNVSVHHKQESHINFLKGCFFARLWKMGCSLHKLMWVEGLLPYHLAQLNENNFSAVVVESSSIGGCISWVRKPDCAWKIMLLILFWVRWLVRLVSNSDNALVTQFPKASKSKMLPIDCFSGRFLLYLSAIDRENCWSCWTLLLTVSSWRCFFFLVAHY